LKCGLYSPTEMAINPRVAIAQIANSLQKNHRVVIHWSTPIVRIEDGTLYDASGQTTLAGTILVCSGSDFETLFPKEMQSLGLRKCKLQMLRTVAQPDHGKIGTHLAGGLTLTHYSAFESCPTLGVLKQRIQREMPEFVKYGIHVMASQQDTGEITIGDSHEYDSDISPFDKPDINELILSYLDRFLTLPDRRIAGTWSGVYAKHPKRLFVVEEFRPNVFAAVAPGGAGMTLSFGLAEQFWATR
jgi:D-hydroxyproline dehydrogenase subunit beta